MQLVLSGSFPRLDRFAHVTDILYTWLFIFKKYVPNFYFQFNSEILGSATVEKLGWFLADPEARLIEVLANKGALFGQCCITVSGQDKATPCKKIQILMYALTFRRIHSGREDPHLLHWRNVH